HQNSLAKRAIQTIIFMARTFMVHVSLHWCDGGVDDLALWGSAVNYAAWYHVVFDDLFQTVFSSGDNNPVVDEICNDLFEFNRDIYAEDELM
ncbi:hypothetical protein ACHAW6_014841, partial [Cyclotella cf. meneghiniana]